MSPSPKLERRSRGGQIKPSITARAFHLAVLYYTRRVTYHPQRMCLGDRAYLTLVNQPTMLTNYPNGQVYKVLQPDVLGGFRLPAS